MRAHPPTGIEHRLHVDVKAMAELWAQMLVTRTSAVANNEVDSDILAALDRWRPVEGA